MENRGDSLCAALKLARPESKRILIVGAGTVGHSLRAAYGAGFPDAEFLIWNRTATTAEAFAAKYPNTRAAGFAVCCCDGRYHHLCHDEHDTCVARRLVSTRAAH